MGTFAEKFHINPGFPFMRCCHGSIGRFRNEGKIHFGQMTLFQGFFDFFPSIFFICGKHQVQIPFQGFLAGSHKSRQHGATTAFHIHGTAAIQNAVFDFRIKRMFHAFRRNHIQMTFQQKPEFGVFAYFLRNDIGFFCISVINSDCCVTRFFQYFFCQKHSFPFARTQKAVDAAKLLCPCDSGNFVSFFHYSFPHLFSLLLSTY